MKTRRKLNKISPGKKHKNFLNFCFFPKIGGPNFGSFCEGPPYITPESSNYLRDNSLSVHLFHSRPIARATGALLCDPRETSPRTAWHRNSSRRLPHKGYTCAWCTTHRAAHK